MMSDAVRYETREPPTDRSIVDVARNAPGTWVYDVDHAYPPDQPVPAEAIRGSWEVDASGHLSGRYARNARYRPIERPRRTLKPYMHAAARNNRDQWIVEIDPRGESLFPNVPQELVRGWWYVDADGKITDSFRPNSLWAEASPSDAGR